MYNAQMLIGTDSADDYLYISHHSPKENVSTINLAIQYLYRQENTRSLCLDGEISLYMAGDFPTGRSLRLLYGHLRSRPVEKSFKTEAHDAPLLCCRDNRIGGAFGAD
jgi:hypothetical protein